jgi:hypothetical protein
MATTTIDFSTAERALDILDELMEQQRAKVRECARRLHPGLTDDDFRIIHTFPAVCNDPVFQYEDGRLAGYTAAKIALKAQLIGGTLKQS